MKGSAAQVRIFIIKMICSPSLVKSIFFFMVDLKKFYVLTTLLLQLQSKYYFFKLLPEGPFFKLLPSRMNEFIRDVWSHSNSHSKN